MLLPSCEREVKAVHPMAPELWDEKAADNQSVATRAPSSCEEVPEPLRAALREACRALERADLQAAGPSIGKFAVGSSAWAYVLRARYYNVGQDDVAAVRELEAAKQRFPDCAEIYATGTEIHARAGRMTSAGEELAQGIRRVGPKPALRRAKALTLLVYTGDATQALSELERARAADPELPFCDSLLARSHLLLGNRALGGKAAEQALAHAREALRLEPDLDDARQLEADAQVALGQFAAALDYYEARLLRAPAGKSALATLYHRAATADLVQGEQDRALQRYLRAKALGLSEAELGHGAQAIQRHVRDLIEQGGQAYEQGQWDAAAAAFEQVLAIDADDLEANNHLAAVCFRKQDYQQAAERWTKVLELARARSVSLPEPVELNLARALHQIGDEASIRRLLDAKLAAEPDWKWAREARDLLARL